MKNLYRTFEHVFKRRRYLFSLSNKADILNFISNRTFSSLNGLNRRSLHRSRSKTNFYYYTNENSNFNY